LLPQDTTVLDLVALGGGPCTQIVFHVQTPPVVAVEHSLGFRAWLVSRSPAPIVVSYAGSFIAYDDGQPYAPSTLRSQLLTGTQLRTQRSKLAGRADKYIGGAAVAQALVALDAFELEGATSDITIALAATAITFTASNGLLAFNALTVTW